MRMGFLMQAHPLTNFEVQKCYQNKPRCLFYKQSALKYKGWGIPNKP